MDDSSLYMPTHTENMELKEEYKQRRISREQQMDMRIRKCGGGQSVTASKGRTLPVTVALIGTLCFWLGWPV
jgi:hypothetical protein